MADTKTKHSAAPVCKSCQEKISEAHPELRKWWLRIKKQFPDAHLSWVWRNKHYQDLFHSLGKSECLWPNSKHNHTDFNVPCSMAMDLFKLRDDNVAVFPLLWYRSIWEWLQGEKAPMRWGGDFRPKIDGPHYELTIQSK